MKRCAITGRRPMAGHYICRRGLSKKSGGIGIKTTAINSRRFFLNLQERKLWVPELKRYVRAKISAKALRTAEKRGLYKVLVESGVVKSK